MMSDRPKEKDESQLWNFARLLRAIHNFNLPEVGNQQAKKIFLQSINTHLNVMVLEIKSILFHKGYTTSCITECVDEITGKYMQAYTIAYDFADAMMDLTAEEYFRHYRDDSDDRPYECLLSEIAGCCVAIRQNLLNKKIIRDKTQESSAGMIPHIDAAQNENLEMDSISLREYLLRHEIFYDFALASGGKIRPLVQGFDPLIGTREIDSDMFAGENEGYCSGAVENWAHVISSTGITKSATLLDEFSYDHQNSQNRLPNRIERNFFSQVYNNPERGAFQFYRQY